jgi:hypothetical protein
MVRAGILTEDDPVELLEGWLVPKTPKTSPHRIATGLVQDALQAIIPQDWYLEIQEPITLSDSEPEPDAVLARGSRRDSLGRHLGAAEVGLLVEVADTSLERDRTVKKTIYAAAGISVYWILNLVDRRLEVYQDTSGPSDAADYRTIRIYEAADSVPVFLDGTQIGILQVATLLP